MNNFNFPICSYIGSSAFYYSNIASINAPRCTSIGMYAFQNCSALATASFPACTSIGVSAFGFCQPLSTASFPVCTSIGNYAFRACYNLLSLYLTGSSLCSLANVNAFTSTPISDYTTSTGGVYGSIYVPASLLASYKAATN